MVEVEGKVIIKTGVGEIELTIEEAQELFIALKEKLGVKEDNQPVIPYVPNPVPTPYEWPDDWTRGPIFTSNEYVGYFHEKTDRKAKS